MASPYLDRFRAHAVRHESLQIGIDRSIFGRNRIEARLGTPSGIFRLAAQKRLVEWLLDSVEHPGAGLRQIAGKIAEECSLGEPSFLAVEDDACRGQRRRKLAGQSSVIFS